MTSHLFRTHRLGRGVAAALAVMALAAPTAVARPVFDRSVPVSPSGHGDAQPADIRVSARPSAPTVVTADDGFDWNSAGVGAGAGAGILLLTLAGLVAFSRSHEGFRPIS
jgi:hypothetical protein